MQRFGVAIAAGSALGYAGTTMFQKILGDDGLHSATVMSIRFGVSGLILLGVCWVRGKPIVPARGDRLAIFLLGALCYMLEASLYFSATRHGSPAAVIVLVYLYPVFVTVAVAVQARRRPSRAVLGALALSVIGCAVVATAGSAVSIEPLGVVFALGSAASFALYVLLGARVGTRSDPVVTGAWVALGACASLGVQALFGPGFAATGGHWPALIGNGLANAVAFGLMFAALTRLGAARASVVFTTEVVFTAVLSAVLLDQTLAPLQAVGAAAVLFATVVILKSGREAPEPLAERVEGVEVDAVLRVDDLAGEDVARG